MNWTTEKRKLKDLIPYGSNPRILSEKQHKDLTASLKKFGLAEIPAIDADNTLIAGHQRVKILSELNPPDFEIDVRVPDRKLTKKEFQEYNVRSNKNTGTWDFDILANEFEQDELIEWGFEEKELVGLFIEDKTDEELDDAPEPQKEAISKLGDIFLLGGKHRVMCGDSTNREDVELLMDGKKADMVFTDPPYGLNLDGDNSKRGKSTSLMKGGLKLKSFIDDSVDYAVKAFNIVDELNIKRQVWWGGNYYCHSLPQTGNWFVWDKRVEDKMKNTNSDCELAWVKSEFNSVRIFRHLWNGLVKASEHGQRRVHPTQKPVALAVWSFDYFKNVILVLDLFLGSGSTLIACEQTNRICYGMELDPIYIDVILKRYNKLYPDKEIKCLTRSVDFNKMFV